MDDHLAEILIIALAVSSIVAVIIIMLAFFGYLEGLIV